MESLKEMAAVRQIPGEPRRRWFRSDAMDLMVWFDERDGFFGFQLSYDMPRAERVLTWTRNSGFMHTGLDDGEGKDFGYKAAPILVADGRFDGGRIIPLFAAASAGIPGDIAAFVESKLREFPGPCAPAPAKGLMRRIRVLPYDPAWPSEYEKEIALILQALGDTALESHHIGSTSVPGLAAKPVIDILLVVRSHTETDGKRDAMERLGYEAAGEFGIAGRRFFRKGGDIGRSHHVHAYEQGHPEIGRHLVFRDFLRAHPEWAKRYGDIKTALAPVHSDDIQGYMDGKAPLIAEILRLAAEWNGAAPAD